MRNRKKLIISLLLTVATLCSSENISAQNAPSEKKGFSKDRIFTGGSFGLWFGNQTFIDISPLVGYKVTDQYVVGIGVTYIYYREKYYDILGDEHIFSTSHYGGRIFNRYYITEYLFAHGEYEALSIEYFNPFPDIVERRWIGSVLLGGGYAQQMGMNSYWSILVLYNFNETLFYPYPNPIIRIGVGFGL